MNSTMWSYFFVMAGILGIVLINIFSDILIANEQDYFILKEATEAAMVESVDPDTFSYGLTDEKYRSEYNHCPVKDVPGTIRIDKDKFVESFLIRFTNSITLKKTYDINIVDISECPPKVSIAIKAKDKYSFIEFFRVSYDSGEQVVSRITGILEKKPWEEVVEKK